MANNNKSGGFSLGTLIFVIFLILKLTETGPVAHWSWWWVTAPLWIPFGIVILFFVITAIIAITYKSFK
jgi:hypothetical protein